MKNRHILRVSGKLGYKITKVPLSGIRLAVMELNRT